MTRRIQKHGQALAEADTGSPRLRFALAAVAAAFLWDGGGLSIGSDSRSLYAGELAPGSAAEAAKTPASRERWRAIYVGGAQIG